MKKVLFIANIGYRKRDIPNGVNVKNRHILKYLETIEDTEVNVVDTDNWKTRVIQLFFIILKNTFSSDKIVLSINTKSAYHIIKFLNYINMEKKLIYFAVGGTLHDQIANNELKLKNFENIYKIYVQTESMEIGMKKLGLNNVSELPNSKYFEDIEITFNYNIQVPIESFYLGRIHPDKGIDMIFEALDKINKKTIKYKVDFYGPIQDNYKNEFLMKVKNSNYAKYNGIINLIESRENYEKLSEYDLFLFPSYWKGEGFPGVVLDSFISGVPVLASDWNHNTQVIENGVNGIIFESKNVKDFIDKLNFVLEDPNILLNMSRHAYNESKKYKSENVLKVLDSLI